LTDGIIFDIDASIVNTHKMRKNKQGEIKVGKVILYIK
jgi:hypothetical protein